MSSGVAKWHGKTIFEQFFKLLTPEQRNNIQLVSGDGAKWIDECIKEYCPNANRCVDPFHVIEWAMDALDSVRVDAWWEAKAATKEQPKEVVPGMALHQKIPLPQNSKILKWHWVKLLQILLLTNRLRLSG